ncbi:hypothetical protein CHL67_05950 [Prosthecochloris sp. GSB1]|uniref:hypothetical protein n=1 Tax=Prosthecochloris sp. GSB1 TaxID=281093 RepID=UPI000B8CDC72|nr:hypothetical protein [Prosthecochloris sp. GSB1]ASQ90520.1 hypothetical protein CHL67_05950 [Prosthecochloris sp. GSB1]
MHDYLQNGGYYYGMGLMMFFWLFLVIWFTIFTGIVVFQLKKIVSLLQRNPDITNPDDKKAT